MYRSEYLPEVEGPPVPPCELLLVSAASPAREGWLSSSLGQLSFYPDHSDLPDKMLSSCSAVPPVDEFSALPALQPSCYSWHAWVQVSSSEKG